MFKRPTIAVISLLASVMVGAGCTTSSSTPARLIFAMAESEPTNFNVLTGSGASLAGGTIVQVITPSVFNVNPELEWELNDDLMESVEQTKSDPQTVVYKINKDANWSDGEPISGDDFVYLWSSIAGPDAEVNVAGTTGYDRMKKPKVSDDGKTVTVTYSEAFSEWQAMFANLYPAHKLKKIGWVGLSQNAVAKGRFSFSGGPFKIDSYKKGKSITLVANDDYYGKKAELDKIVVRFVSPDSVAKQLKNSEADMSAPQPQVDLVEQLENIDGIVTDVRSGLSWEHLTFNLRNEFLAQPEVRQAIAYALDRNEIVKKLLSGFARDAKRLDNNIWMTSQPQYEAHGKKYQKQDTDAAKEALESAGFSLGDDGIYAKDGERLSLRISTTGGNALREDAQKLIQDQLKEAGIEIVIDNLPGGAVFDKIFPFEGEPDFDIAMFAWFGAPNAISGTKDTFVADGFNNSGGYENADLSDMFDEALATSDTDKAVGLSQDIDEILWDELPAIPLYTKPTLLAYRDTFDNVANNPSSAGALWNANEILLKG